jgi:hypothetical protein
LQENQTGAVREEGFARGQQQRPAFTPPSRAAHQFQCRVQ